MQQSMKRNVVWALVTVNAVLATLLVGRLMPDNRAVAQAARPGDFLLIPGTVLGGPGGAVIYVLDTANQTLGGIYYNNPRKTIEAMPPIDLVRIFAAAEGGDPAGNAPPRR